MPAIMRSLCDDEGMVAFGHNDLLLDNAYFWRDDGGALQFGLFDWQQACLNNVGQECAGRRKRNKQTSTSPLPVPALSP